jgi:hypothetical protein
LADKIESLMGDRSLVLRGGRDGYTQDLNESLAQWLEGPQAAGSGDDESEVRRLDKEVLAQAKALANLENRLCRRADWEVQWGNDTTVTASKGVLSRWLRSCRLKLTDWQLARQGFYWDLMGNYQQQLKAHHQTIAQSLQAATRHRRRQALNQHRREFLKLSKALRARTNRKQEEWFAQIDLDLLLRTLPVWLTPLSDADRLLPFKPALFDLAIIDEATQCDMASCLPVFFRAKRVVITGDPRQLRHVSFLSRERQRLLGGKWGLSDAEMESFDYREKSILDWVNEAIPSQEQVIFLDEHFRSRPPIIAFSNREFYRGALKIMTQRPDTTAAPSVEVRTIIGKRENGGPNRIEADALITEIIRMVESQKKLPGKLAHSLGVLSPFREQVDHLFARLTKQLEVAAIKKHRIRVGTAHSFQGEERDIMFLSFALDRDAHPGTLRYLDRADVFNVSVTRARNLQVVFCSVAAGDLPPKSLLRRYLEAVGKSVTVDPANAPEDAFLREVQATLLARGYHTWPCYVVAGLPVDLLIAKDGHSLGIDLVGYPGSLVNAFDLERHRLFQRAGLRLFPLSYSAWCNERPMCLQAIDRWMSEVNCYS